MRDRDQRSRGRFRWALEILEMFHLHTIGHSEKRGRSSGSQAEPGFIQIRLKPQCDKGGANLVNATVPSYAPTAYRTINPPHRTGYTCARLQIIFQIFVDELELCFSAVHPGDGKVREW